MYRDVRVEINHGTWLRKPVPPGLRTAVSTWNFSIFDAFLLLAWVTRLPTTRGVSIHDTWALIRYFPALADHPGLALADATKHLDPHQKAIISDDWGMAIPLLFLTDALSLTAVCQTTFLMKMLSALRITRGPVTPKMGTGKSPDFIARDAAGLLHIIESKGTQSSRAALAKAMDVGIQQKSSLVVSAGQRGETLVAGLYLARHPKHNSVIEIIDPPSGVRALPEISKENLDRIFRFSELSQAFDIIGLHSMARSIADFAENEPSVFSDRSAAFDDERDTLISFEQDRKGVKRLLEFPVPIEASGRRYSSLQVTASLPEEIVNSVAKGARQRSNLLDTISAMKFASEAIRIESSKEASRLSTQCGLELELRVLE